VSIYSLLFINLHSGNGTNFENKSTILVPGLQILSSLDKTVVVTPE
jgi:hypothetical protein